MNIEQASHELALYAAKTYVETVGLKCLDFQKFNKQLAAKYNEAYKTIKVELSGKNPSASALSFK